LGLRTGNSITIEQAILAVATRSANDAAFLLAERQGKTEKNFALKMTIQAKALGMSNTMFYNAAGLPNAKQVTTARDMAVLARAIRHDFPEYYKYFSTPNFTYQKRTYSNINGFLNAYSGADGLKTGFTCGSGYNIIATATRNNISLIAIVMGAKNSYARTIEIKALLDKGFKNIKSNTISKNITEPQPESLKPAPYLLSTAQCNQSYKASSYRNRISGWSVVFGAFPKKSQARALLRKVKPKMMRHAKYGHPVILKRMQNGVFLWHALWSGLKKNQAGKICKSLWVDNQYCRAMHPALFSKK
jgi:D-alanyl-D-alanine carboxypeptidase